MLKWEDCTNYNQHDPGNRPRIYEANAGPLRITIRTQHTFCPDEWVFQTDPLIFNVTQLSLSSDVSARIAQDRAETLVREKVGDILQALSQTGMYKNLWNTLKKEVEKGIAAYNAESAKTDKTEELKIVWLESGRQALIEVRSFMGMIKEKENISKRFFENENKLQVGGKNL